MRDPFSPGPFGGFDSFMFNAVPFIVVMIFIAVIIMFIVGIANNIRNASMPRKTVRARIAAKRMEVTGSPNAHHHADGTVHHGFSTRTHYYITLEFENGERREFLDVNHLYGLVAEGDVGYAAVQGDWIVAFERQPMADPERNREM